MKRQQRLCYWERKSDQSHLFAGEMTDDKGGNGDWTVKASPDCSDLQIRIIQFRIAITEKLGKEIEECIRQFIQSPATRDIYLHENTWHTDEYWRLDDIDIPCTMQFRKPTRRNDENDD